MPGGGDPGAEVAPGPWKVPGVRCPFLRVLLCVNKACPALPRVSAPQEAPPGSGAGERGGGAVGPHVPAEECGGAGPGRGGDRRRLGHGAPGAARRRRAAAAVGRGRRHPLPGLRQLRERRGGGGDRAGGGRRQAHPRLFACRSAGLPVSSGGAGRRARGSRALQGTAGWQGSRRCWVLEGGRGHPVTGALLPSEGSRSPRAPRPRGSSPLPEGSRSAGLSPLPEGPVFNHAWVPEARAIEVWVPEGPALMVRLCHQLALECEELPRPFHQQVLVLGGSRVSLPYEFLVPCLCIEVRRPPL
uniref:Uncharacterized protein n=1 Tax=Falco tinnunculus TaxID=100819 RepID=A0A8C4UC98_FALTI